MFTEQTNEWIQKYKNVQIKKKECTNRLLSTWIQQASLNHKFTPWAWAAPLPYTELYFQHFVKIKCQHHSSVVNSTDINRDINIHRAKRYPWSPCLHYSETFAWKGTNWVKCSGSLSTHYKSSSCKMSIYLSTNCVYHSIRKHMDETKGLVLHMTLLEPSST